MPLNLRRIFRAAQLLTLLFIIINVFISKKECSGQTFHYSHGWTNGKRSDPLIDRIDTIQKKGRSFDQRRRRMAFKRDDKLVRFLLDENIRNMDKDGSEMFLPERYPSTLS
ncbi:unnamed protein product [Lepeophtheirus salmonis]|uniref:Pro-corazonin n=1 Tax=Lepeophtheirus salmonis TaxID=72036 RepID=A0A7R8H0H1_LEPSM|nr:unnamed protein product [Lepeophtheirus salmonis]CAF2789847.1 unnamed protein product [Lepeophtheirus salmonis]